jgi:hypothetical protein
MSTINVSNITDGTTTVGTSYVVNGSAKAWIFFQGTGTVNVLDSFNISSVDDNGTGNYDLNYASSFSSANISPVGTSNWRGVLTHDAYSATDTNLATREGGSSSKGDRGRLSVTVHGDLA